MHVEWDFPWGLVGFSTLSHVDVFVWAVTSHHFSAEALCLSESRLSADGNVWDKTETQDFKDLLFRRGLADTCRGWERKGCLSLCLESLQEQLVQVQSLSIVTLTSCFFVSERCPALCCDCRQAVCSGSMGGALEYLGSSDLESLGFALLGCLLWFFFARPEYQT